MIDERVSIHPSAKIGKNVTIEAFSCIGANVTIGDGTWIGSNVVIEGPTTMGKNNRIYPFAALGGDPQDLKFHSETTYLDIGDNNLFRECCTVHRGTKQGGDYTRIGSHNLIMNYVHIAHDCQIGSHIVFANNTSLAGHVTVHDHANFGGFSLVRQFVNIGSYSFLAKNAKVAKDVLPYILVSGEQAKVLGLNSIGLKRHNFSEETLAALNRAYRIIFRSGLKIDEAVAELLEVEGGHPEIQLIIEGIKASEGRGIAR